MEKKKTRRVKRMVQGITIDLTCGSVTEAETLNKLIDQLDTQRLGSNQHKKKISLAQAWCGLIDDKKEEGRDLGTIKRVMSPLRIFGDMLHRDVMDIEPKEFTDAFSKARNMHTGGPLAMRTMEGYAITLREVLKKSLELGAGEVEIKKINREIMKVVKSSGVPEKNYTSYTLEERDHWLNSPETLPPWVRLYVRASLASFKRGGELMGLGWPDVDFIKRRILINKQVTSGRFKWGLKAGGTAHYVEMDDELFEIFTKLKEWQVTAGIDSDWVFASTSKAQVAPFLLEQKSPYRGKPVSRMLIKLRVNEDMNAAEISLKKIHDLRRTAATLYFITSEADFKTVMMILQSKLNHSSILITQEYISASAEYIQSMVNKINKTGKSNLEKRLVELENEKRILELEIQVNKLKEELRLAA